MTVRRPVVKRDLFWRVEHLERLLDKLQRLVGPPRHIGSTTPTGGTSGDIVVGNGKIWANDRGTWKSTTIT